MAKCPDFDLSKAITNQFTQLGMTQESLVKKDRKAVQVAQSNGLLDFPLANLLIQDAINFLSSAAAGVGAGIIHSVAGEVSAVEASILNVIASIATVGTQFQLLVAGLMLDQLKKELSIRDIYYQLLMIFIRNILTVLKSYQQLRKGNYYKVQLALLHVKKAEKYFIQAQRNDSVTSRNLLVIDRAFKEIDIALNYLEVGTQTGQTVFNVAQKRGVGQAWKLLRNSFSRDVIGNTLYNLESLSWSMIQMTSLFPIPTPTVAWANSVTAGLSEMLPGYTGPKFNPTVKDREIQELKKQKTISADLDIIDLSKGLIATNVLINQLLQQILTIEVDWTLLEKICRDIITLLSPVLPIVQEVRQSMEESSDDDELTLAAKTIEWIAKLSTVKEFNRFFSTAVNGSLPLLQSVEKLAYFKVLVEEYLANNVDTKIVEFMVLSLASTSQALFSKRALQEAVVLNTTGLALVRRGMQQNKTLLTAVPSNMFKNTAAGNMFNQLLGAMQRLPAPANIIANAFATGQLSTVVTSLAALTANAGGVISAIRDFSCNDTQTTLEAPIDPEANMLNKHKKSREEQLGLEGNFA